MTTTTTTQHGGPRPALRPDDGRHAASGRAGKGKAGAIRIRVTVADLLPGAPLSEPTVSAADITIWRCQACGAVWWDGYGENVYGLEDGPAIAEVRHEKRAPRHRPGCAMDK